MKLILKNKQQSKIWLHVQIYIIRRQVKDEKGNSIKGLSIIINIISFVEVFVNN